VPIYLFYVSKASSPTCFEAFELADDAAALSRAPQVLDDHLTCTSVEVCLGGRTIATLVREGEAVVVTRTSADGTKIAAPPPRSQLGRRRANPNLAPTAAAANGCEKPGPSAALLQFPVIWPADHPTNKL